MSATACVPKSGDGDETAGSPSQRVATIVKTRAAACKTARSDPLEAVSLCTSSGQCGAGSLCCKHWDENAGINVSLCQATTACPENEHCAHGQPCSTPGSICVLGLCGKPDAEIMCRGRKCQKGQVCCSGPTRCTSAEECAKSQGTAPHRALHFACDGPADCPDSMVCVGTAMVSSCRAKWQPDADRLQKLVCKTDAHCSLLQCPKDTRATCDSHAGQQRCGCKMETPAAAKGQASKSQCAAECERSVSKQLGGCDQKPGLGAGHCKLMAKGMVALCRSKRCGENTAAEAIND